MIKSNTITEQYKSVSRVEEWRLPGVADERDVWWMSSELIANGVNFSSSHCAHEAETARLRVRRVTFEERGEPRDEMASFWFWNFGVCHNAILIAFVRGW